MRGTERVTRQPMLIGGLRARADVFLVREVGCVRVCFRRYAVDDATALNFDVFGGWVRGCGSVLLGD